MAVVNAPLDMDDLSRIVQAVDPSARLVPARLVRRAIRRHFGLSAGQDAPHDICFEATRTELLECIDCADLGGAELLPERVLLLPIPEEEPTTPERIRLDLWRRLFHAAIDRAVASKGGVGFAADPVLFNATILHEIRTVLYDEKRLPPVEDDSTLYREFTSFYLELEFFASEMLEAYFPGFLNPREVAHLLGERFNANGLYEATRLAQTPAPEAVAHSERGLVVWSKRRSLTAVQVLTWQFQAAQAHEIGNDVRAAILNGQAGNVGAAEDELRRLVERLKVPLQFEASDAEIWYDAVRPLLEPATRGFWPVAGRLLYELQKACLDVERKVYAIDVVECVVTFGEQPLKRLMDRPCDLNVLRRLRAALKFSPRAGLTFEQSERLDALLQKSITDVELRVRRRNRPILEAVLDEVGIVPANPAERVARQTIAEELLDALCMRGFLKMTDVRDALARNRLKLNDLSGPGEFIRGDPLIRANHKLALRMDGLYRRGEIYMRTFQRGSSLAFGTILGRLLMLFVVLPFGGAYVGLEGLHHFIGAIRGLVHFVGNHIIAEPGEAAVHSHGHGHGHAHSFLTSYTTIGLVGMLLLALIHLPGFRRQFGIFARTLLLDLPSAFYYSPIVCSLFDNYATRLFARYLLTPLVVGSLSAIGARFVDFSWEAAGLVGAGAALLIGVVFRTPWGRGWEERLNEILARVWRIVSANFLIGLLMLILNFFKIIMEQFEKGMYAVDEWLRFHEGESTATFALKLLFGTIWFFLAYVFRFAWNLLIEPQINPVKHFPVVTVSHKLLLPMVPDLAETFNLTVPTTTTIVSGIPGIFGFLVWELKENWKLYKANSPSVIRSAPVGSHGERVRSLLRPGFHSGVVPKTFAKLRRADSAGKHARAVKLHHRLEHVAEAIRHLAERRLAAYLLASRRWDGLPIRVERIRLATNRLRIPLSIRDWEGLVVVSVEERGGWLIGSLEQTAWIPQLDEKQRAAFQDVLTALYKLGGVHIVREQVAAVLGIDAYRLDCRPEGLLVLPKNDGATVAIDCRDEPTMTPNRPLDGRLLSPLPVAELMLTECPIDWQRWVARWEQDQAGKAPLEPLLGRYRVM